MSNLHAPIDLQKNPSKFTSEFAESRKSRTGKSVLHNGIDLAPDSGSSGPVEILSMQEGVVIKVGTQIGKDKKGYGNFIVIKNPDGTSYLYAHLQSSSLTKGNKIEAGDTIGIMGESGAPGQYHLHIEKLTQEATEIVQNTNGSNVLGIVGGTEGLKHRIDLTEELLIGFTALAANYAKELGGKFDLQLNQRAHTVTETNAVLKTIKKFLSSLFNQKSKLTGLEKNKRRKTVRYQIDFKIWVSVADAIQMVKKGLLDGVIVTNSKGTTFLKTRPDATTTNNLV